MKRIAASLSALVTASFVSTAFAQEGVTKYVPQDPLASPDLKRTGWDGALGIAANLSLAQNDSVVGQIDGLSLLFGLSFTGGLDYLYGPHELRNNLTIASAWSRTPAVDEFLKTSDLAKLESIYNYFFAEKFGAFTRLNFETSILPAQNVQPTEVTYSIQRIDGSTDERVGDARLKLSDSFQPFTMNQSIGAFVEPVQKEEIAVSFRLGLGARETLARGALLLQDDAATTELEVVELDNVYQGGAEAFLGIEGTFVNKRATYRVGANLLLPLLNNDPLNRSAVDLTVVGVAGVLTFSVVEWMSVNYTLRILNDPQLVDAVQIQNAMLLTFNYNLIERAPLPPTLDPAIASAQEAAVEAIERAKDAERRAAEAEARTKLLEEEAARLRGEVPPPPPPPSEGEAPAPPAPGTP